MKKFLSLLIRIFPAVILSMLLQSCPKNKKTKDSELTSGIVKHFDDADDIHVAWNKTNTAIVHFISEPDNLHPTNGNSTPRTEILQYLQRTLLYIDFENQKIVPGLAKSMPEISADKKTYTFIIRDDVKWDDGSPLTSEDILFTAKAFKCPLTNDFAIRPYWDNVKNIITFPETPGKFSIEMKKVNNQNIAFLSSFYLLQRSFHDKKNVLASYSFEQLDDTTFKSKAKSDITEWAADFNSDKYGRDPSFENGLGMYKLTSWSPGEFISIERKKNHWSFHSEDYHELSYPEKIIFRLNKDESSQILQLKSQEMDVSTNLSVSAFLKLNNDKEFTENYNMAMMPTYNYTYLCFNEKPVENNRKRLFDDLKVRSAMAKITPVDDIINLQYKQFAGQCKKMISNVPVMKREFNNKLKPVTYNISLAEQHLAEAGWKDTDHDGILDKVIDGKKISFEAELNYISSSADWKEMASLIAESMEKAGIKITPVGMELKLFLEKAKAHDFDLMLGSWGGTCLPEDYTQLWRTTSWSNHGSNYSGFGNARTDELIDSIKTATNDSLQILLSHRLQEDIYNDQPYVFLYSSLRRNVIHKRFGNQMLFSERPGILVNMLRLLSVNKGITMNDEATP